VPVQPDHHGDAANKEQDIGENREQSVGTDALHFADVVIDARDQIAKLGLVVVPRC
jgi:hypothetical protein